MRTSFTMFATVALAATMTTACSTTSPPTSATPTTPTTAPVSATAADLSSVSVPTATATGERPTTRSSTASTMAASSEEAATDAPKPAGCDPTQIADDIDRKTVTVDVCAGEWAYVSSPGPGDTSAFVRASRGTWSVFDVQPGARCRSEAESDGVPDPLLQYFNACGPDSKGSGATAADLGLTTSISAPACDSTGIVILGSATDPDHYRRDVAALLKAHSGAAYLITDRTCASLRQATASGDHIYAVYRPAGETAKSICAAVQKAGGDAYGKRLNPKANPPSDVRCPS